MPDTLKADLVLVGIFGAAHGVRGEIRLKSYTQDPAAIGDYGPLSSKNGQIFELLTLRPVKDDMFVARIKGVADRNGAEALTNTELFVPRSQLPPPDEDEFYYSDLIGLRAETDEGLLLGHVRSLENFGAGDIIEIAPETGETLGRAQSGTGP
eukprot:gene13576-13695_t